MLGNSRGANAVMIDEKTGACLGDFIAAGSSGAFIDTFATGNGLKRPCGNAFGPDGNLGVAQLAQRPDLRCDGRTGPFIDVFAQDDGMPAGLLNGPHDLVVGPDGLLSTTDCAGGIRSCDTLTGARVQTIPTGALFGSGLATTLGNLMFAPDGTLYAPVFNDGANGVKANGAAACAVASRNATGLSGQPNGRGSPPLARKLHHCPAE